MRARLLAQRSQLALYDGDQDRLPSLSAAALDLARRTDDDRALVGALRARKEACPGLDGREERLRLADEMVALGRRARDARSAMWGTLWRIEALLEGGRLAAAAEELAPLQVAIERVGGPVSAWHLDRVTACVAQAQGRYTDAASAARRGFERMRPVELGPARGAFFSLQCALASHVGPGEDAAPFVQQPFVPLPLFRTVGRLARAFLCLRAGLPEEAAVSYQHAGALDSWFLPPFAVPLGYVYGALVAAELGRHDDLAALLERLEPFRGGHATTEGVAYLGPVELALGRGAAALGRLDAAVDDLTAAAEQADRAGAAGFSAEARFHLAATLLARDGPGDRDRARPPPATPTASRERSAWPPTWTAPPPWSPGSATPAAAGGPAT